MASTHEKSASKFYNQKEDVTYSQLKSSSNNEGCEGSVNNVNVRGKKKVPVSVSLVGLTHVQGGMRPRLSTSVFRQHRREQVV